MSFFEDVDKHIDHMLCEGVLPDSEEIIEMEVGPVMHDGTVPNQKPGPQHSGPEGGPVSAPAASFPWLGRTWAAGGFAGASRGAPADGIETRPAMFSNQNRGYPPAMFSGAATGMAEEGEVDSDAVIDAVLSDLQALQDDDE
jgi:hypothetical protein